MASLGCLPPKQQTDWSKCCLCQDDKKEDLKSPPTHYPCSMEQDGYSMIAKNVPLFHAISEMPIMLDPARLDEGYGIDKTLRRNHAKYHQTCRTMFNNTKLERAKKRRSTSPSSSAEGRAKIRRTSLASSSKQSECFLCEKVAPTSSLRQAMTSYDNAAQQKSK